jgi:hypothetical protein
MTLGLFMTLMFRKLPLYRVRRDIQFEANMKQIFTRFKAKKTDFIRLFRIEANRRISHAK